MAKWRDVKNNRVSKENLKKDSFKSNSSQNLATLSQRFRAFLTDLFLITTPIIYLVIYVIMGGGDGFAQNRTLGWGIILLLCYLIIGIFWLKNGQTPGLKSYDIKLVDNKTEGRLSVIQASVRFITTFFAIVLIAPLFYCYFNKDRKTFQDLLSNTKIIKQA